MQTRRGHRCGQPAEQRQRVHVDRDRPVGEGLFQDDADQSVGALRDALLGHRRPEHVLAERLAPGRVEGPGTRRGVQREAIEARGSF